IGIVIIGIVIIGIVIIGIVIIAARPTSAAGRFTQTTRIVHMLDLITRPRNIRPGRRRRR
ncbi:MAG: hypothetical protein ACKVHU_12455, partial [Acidimicrobiales bacterium]